MMGGIRYYLGTADSNANVRTVSGLLSVFDFDEVVSNVWGRYTNNVAKKCLVSMNTKRIINRLLAPLQTRRRTLQRQVASTSPSIPSTLSPGPYQLL
jgi:hypothetical protein